MMKNDRYMEISKQWSGVKNWKETHPIQWEGTSPLIIKIKWEGMSTSGYGAVACNRLMCPRPATEARSKTKFHLFGDHRELLRPTGLQGPTFWRNGAAVWWADILELLCFQGICLVLAPIQAEGRDSERATVPSQRSKQNFQQSHRPGKKMWSLELTNHHKTPWEEPVIRSESDDVGLPGNGCRILQQCREAINIRHREERQREKQGFLHFNGTERIKIWVQTWPWERGPINNPGAQLETPKSHTLEMGMRVGNQR